MIPTVKTNKGEALDDLSDKQPVLLIFLRHFGCTFCREAMSDIEKNKEAIEGAGVKIVFVHMKSENYATQIFNIYGLESVSHISDPQKLLYHYFGLDRGKIEQLFSWKVWVRAFVAGFINGHLIGTEQGDGFQMPGVFVINKNKIIASFVHKLASDRPDYLALAKKAVMA